MFDPLNHQEGVPVQLPNSLSRNKVRLGDFLQELRRAHETNDTERFKQLMNEFTFSDEVAMRRILT